MLIQLTMITGIERHPAQVLDGEDDGIAASIRPRQEVETTSPVVINTDHIRCFYPRRERDDGVVPVGTRLTFTNSAGMAVTETFEEVSALYNAHT